MKYKIRYQYIVSIFVIVCTMFTDIRVYAADTSQGNPKHILYISSYSYSWETVPLQIDGIDRSFQGNEYVINYEFMDTKNTIYSERYKEFYDILSYKMHTRYPYDGVIVGDDAALNFVQLYRDDLFKDIPIAFIGIDNVDNGVEFAKSASVSGIVEQVDYAASIKIAKKLMPNANRIVFILDNMENGIGIAKQLEKQKEAYTDFDVTYLNSSEYTKEELCDILSSYTLDDIIMYISMGQQKGSVIYTENERYQMMRTYTHTPLFRVTPAGVGSCALGGYVVDFEECGYLAGNMIQEMLDNPSASVPNVILDTPECYYFDYAIIARYGLDVSVIPKDAKIINEPESIWKAYASQIIIGMLIVMLIIMIFVLFVIIRSRKQIENTNKELTKAKETESNFMSTMSHDMRTPMNGILGIARLSEDENDPEMLHKDFEKVKQSGQYMLSLINDILDYQRIHSGKLTLEPKICNTRRIIESALTMVRATADEKNINLIIENDGANFDSFIRVDPVRVSQIIVNLLSNAIKFTPDGGMVKFRIEVLKREGNVIYDKITISDTGVGMSRQYLQSDIYKPFVQEQNEMSMKYAGSGLGLSIVKSLVELMGAEMKVESEIGCGSTFTIYINFEHVSDEEVNQHAKEEKNEIENKNDQLKGCRVLLCEDHPLNAEIVKRLLEKAEMTCDWAENGQKGLELFEKHNQGYYAAILMDIRMPVMDGLETAQAIRKSIHPDAKYIPIIAMSANAFSEDIQKSLDAGMNAHLTKPIVLKEFFETLLHYIKQS